MTISRTQTSRRAQGPASARPLRAAGLFIPPLAGRDSLPTPLLLSDLPKPASAPGSPAACRGFFLRTKRKINRHCAQRSWPKASRALKAQLCNSRNHEIDAWNRQEGYRRQSDHAAAVGKRAMGIQRRVEDFVVTAPEVVHVEAAVPRTSRHAAWPEHSLAWCITPNSPAAKPSA